MSDWQLEYENEQVITVESMIAGLGGQYPPTPTLPAIFWLAVPLLIGQRQVQAINSRQWRSDLDGWYSTSPEGKLMRLLHLEEFDSMVGLLKGTNRDLLWWLLVRAVQRRAYFLSPGLCWVATGSLLYRLERTGALDNPLDGWTDALTMDREISSSDHWLPATRFLAGKTSSLSHLLKLDRMQSILQLLESSFLGTMTLQER